MLTVLVYMDLCFLTSTLRYKICNTHNSLKIENKGIANYLYLDSSNKQEVPDFWIFLSMLHKSISHLFYYFIYT